MRTLTITSDNEKALEKVKELAKKLNIQVKESDVGSSSYPNVEKIGKLFEQLAKEGNIAKVIPDPEAWQREQRKDREMPYRN